MPCPTPGAEKLPPLHRDAYVAGGRQHASKEIFANVTEQGKKIAGKQNQYKARKAAGIGSEGSSWLGPAQIEGE